MIRSISINNFKGIENETLSLSPLTLLTGLNSTGKSTCLQALLAALYYNGGINANVLLSGHDFSFEACRNRNVNAKQLNIEVSLEQGLSFGFSMDETNVTMHQSFTAIDLEDTFYYLSANRLAFNFDTEAISPKAKIGIQGEYVFGTFEQEKSKALSVELIKDNNSATLSAQLNWWLTYILGIRFEMQTEQITVNRVKVIYKSNDLPQLSPQHLGVGVSYLAKILIMCLRAEKGDVLMIESPEIHLHPAAQSRLGEFFAFISNAGIQLLIETHCENLINRIRYEVYKGHLSNNDTIIHYKGGVVDPFHSIRLTESGNFSTEFPAGFFDATLHELLEMN
ncbi:MAG: AAA family ATPase [Muribaculaceae bacterium]|nr:AAA family ATPase [Muribaculaceae bacterium]